MVEISYGSFGNLLGRWPTELIISDFHFIFDSLSLVRMPPSSMWNALDGGHKFYINICGALSTNLFCDAGAAACATQLNNAQVPDVTHSIISHRKSDCCFNSSAPGRLERNLDTVETLYNTVNFCWSTHKRHSIARPKGRGMGCLLWVQMATYCVDLSKLSSIKYLL